MKEKIILKEKKYSMRQKRREDEVREAREKLKERGTSGNACKGSKIKAEKAQEIGK